MRSWILGGCLASVAAGGVYFVATGGGSQTHCGPCVTCPNEEPVTSPDSSDSPAVVEVVDVTAALARPATPPDRPFVSFDEPPLAKPIADRAAAPNVIQAAFENPAPRAEVAPMPRPAPGPISPVNFRTRPLPGTEIAPMPRAVERNADPMPLASPANPF